jgi:hypothetical protein
MPKKFVQMGDLEVVLAGIDKRHIGRRAATIKRDQGRNAGIAPAGDDDLWRCFRGYVKRQKTHFAAFLFVIVFRRSDWFLEALKGRCRRKPAADLKGTTLYTSGGPRPMRMSAILWCGISRVVFAGSIEELAERLGRIILSSRVMAGTAPFAHIEPTPAASTMCGG